MANENWSDKLFKHMSRASALHTLLIILGVGGGLTFVIRFILDLLSISIGHLLPEPNNIGYYFAVLFVVSLFLLYKIIKYVFRVTNYGKGSLIAESFSTMAYVNSRCDAKLFDELHRLMGPLPGEKSSIVDHDTISVMTSCLNIADANIDEILTQTSRLFTVFTGNVCCCCIKIPKTYRNGDAMIEVLTRDKESIAKYGRANNYVYKVDESYSFREILRGNLVYHACDDLRKATRRGEYDNSRPNWNKDYNATLVYPLKSMKKLDNGREDGQTIAFLCIDNHRGGGFETESARHCARTVCSRLEVMLYRLTVFNAYK